MKIPDELLVAYINGELEGAARARIEQAIAKDSRVAKRLSKQRALRERVRSTVAIRRPPVQRWMGATGMAGHGGSAQIIDLAQVRAERARRIERHRPQRSRALWITAAVAAGVGIGMGVLVERLAHSGAVAEYAQGTLQARGVLARALEDQLSGSHLSRSSVQMGLTFKSKDGAYCRTFTLENGASLSGMACRTQHAWQIVALLPAAVSAAASGVHAAATLPMAPALLQIVNTHIHGEPLDSQAETAARNHDWR